MDLRVHKTIAHINSKIIYKILYILRNFRVLKLNIIDYIYVNLISYKFDKNLMHINY